MKVYTYIENFDHYIGTYIPDNATEVITYDSANVLDVSSVYSNAIEGNELAQKIIQIWKG